MRRLLLSLSALALYGLHGHAQCVVGNTNAPGSDPTNVEIGQSFMPLCDGTVEYVEIFCTTGGTNVAGDLKIYSGSTVTSVPIHTQAQPATAVNAGEYLRIYLTGTVVATSFSQLTFELPMSLTIPYSGGNPYPGGRMFYNGTNAALYANSDIRFNVSIVPDCTPSSSALTAQACQSYLSPSGQQWTASGLYTDTIPNAQSCDSVITINLEVTDLDTTITPDGAQLSANATGVTYQWVDCDNGGLPIAGADQQTFTPTTAGTYAVVVSAAGCSEQSACVFAGSTAVYDAERARTWATVLEDGTVLVNGSATGAVIGLFDALGRCVWSKSSPGPSAVLHLPTLPAAGYVLVAPGLAPLRVVLH